MSPWVIHLFAVDEYLVLDNFYLFPFRSDDSLYEVFRMIFRIDEHNHIPSHGMLQRKKLRIRVGNPNPVNEFINEDVIPHKQRGFHRAGGNFEGLNNKGPYKKGDENSND